MIKSQKGRGRGRGRGIQNNQVGAPGNDNRLANNQSPVLQNSQTPPVSSSPRSAGRGRGTNSSSVSNEQDAQTEVVNTGAILPKPQNSPSSESCKPTSDVSRNNLKLLSRPNYGTAGRPIGLISNYFQLQLSGTIYHYDIEITSLDQVKKYGRNFKSKQLTAAEAAEAGIPKLAYELTRSVGKLKRKEVFDKLVKTKRIESFNPVFDGMKNVYTSRRLPFQNKQTLPINLEVDTKVRKYEVDIQPVNDGNNEIHLDQLQKTNEGESEIIMALNSIMNNRDVRSAQIQIGRSFFYLNQMNSVNLGEGLEIWFGYNQSVRTTEKGAVVVLNLAAKAFHKDGPVIDYINDILRRDIRSGEPMRPYEMKNVNDALKGVRVEVTHLSYPRRYMIEGISKLAARDLKLSNDVNNQSVAQYFETKYRKLQFPYLHCLFMRTNNKNTYIPLENCKIMKGQPKMGKLNPSLGAKMIRQTAITPDDRFRSITKSSRDVDRESGAAMRSYNLLLDLNMITVRGRILDPPSLAYCENGNSIPDKRGVWNMSGKKFFKSTIDIDSWILLDFANCSDQTLDRFEKLFVAAGHKVGLNFNRLLAKKRCGRNVSSDQALRDAEKTKAAFAIIILSRRDRFHSYDEIKFIADYQLQFINQCVDEKVLGRFDDQIATNLCLKINAKLGGVNHILRNRSKVFLKPVMIIGADAVHSPRGSRCPSIAAVVGSMDAYPFKYKITCRVQENPDENKISQELILEMRSMMVNLLSSFYHNTRGKRPEKLIYFRDGVSEGQFQAVYEYELAEIQKACEHEVGHVIPVTFVVVQKRHQTRFKPQNPNDGVGKHRNIPPGTAVDTDIVHPHRFDYFLNSHEGIQGTNKPAHYTVLYDDNKFSADELQELSYHLCYTYNKCNRSISIPAPVKYADLACYRAKKYADYHLQKEQENSSSSSNSSINLPDSAKMAINSMGEQGRNFFFV